MKIEAEIDSVSGKQNKEFAPANWLLKWIEANKKWS